MQPTHPCRIEVLDHVLRQIPGVLTGLSHRARPDREITEQLDVHEPMRPRLLDQGPLDEPAHREMDMQPVTRFVPFGRPQIRKRPTTQQ